LALAKIYNITKALEIYNVEYIYQVFLYFCSEQK